MHKDDVSGFNVSMDKSAGMKLRQAADDIEPDTNAIGRRKPSVPFKLGAQGPRCVSFGIEQARARYRGGTEVRILRRGFALKYRFAIGRIGQFHYIIKISLRFIATHVQHMNQAARAAGDWLKAANTRKLAFERTLAIELVPP
jgi:hypothetical protein